MKKQTLFAEFLGYSLFQVLGMVGLSVYILADTFFIAQNLGTNGLAALNLAIPVYNVISGVSLMFGVGGAIVYAVARGRGEDGDAAVRAVLRGTVVCSALFVPVGIFFARPITALLGADDAVFSMTETYLRVILLFAPAFMCNQVLQNFVRSDGDPRLSMLAMLGGSLANILFDYILMVPAQMGILGAVLATGASPVVSMLIFAPHFRGGRGRALLRGRADWRMLPRVLALGFPSFVGEAAAGVVMAAFNFIMLGLGGNIAVAAYGVIANLSIVTTCVMNGVAQGVQPLISRAHGAGEGRAVQRLIGYAVGAVAVCTMLLYGVILIGAEPIVALLNSENAPTLREVAVPGLRLYFSALLFVGLNTLLVALLAATERAFPAQVISIARGLAVILPTAFLLSALWGMTGAWLAYPVAEGVVLLGALTWLGLSRQRADKKIT